MENASDQKKLKPYVIKRLKQKIDPVKKKLLLLQSHELNENQIKVLISDIINKVFGFKKESEIVDIEIAEKNFFYLGTQINNEIIYIVEGSSSILDFENGAKNKIFKYGTKYHCEWLVKTNSLEWKVYRSSCEQPKKYDLSCHFNFLELNLKNKTDVNNLFLICKEAHDKTPSTDQFNRYQWFGFLSEDKKTIEYMFLVNLCHYEDGSAKYHIPLLDITYRCDESLVAQQNADKAIKNYLLDEHGKVYDDDHQFVTVAYHKESEPLKRNYPVWW